MPADGVPVSAGGLQPPKKPGQFQKGGDPRLWQKGRPAGTGFSAWRAYAREFGERPAYNRKGEAIMHMGRHLTFMENILLTWCLDPRLHQLMTDIAYGKVPQTIDLDLSTPTTIHVTLGVGPQPPQLDAASDADVVDVDPLLPPVV